LKKATKGGSLIPASLSETVRIYSADNSYLIAGLPLPLHRPSFALGEGNWYWRRRSVTIDGIVSLPSPPLQFIVSKNSIDYPVPPVKELLNRIPDKHPRLFIRPENLDSLQLLLNISEAHRDLYARISKYADTLLLLPINQEPGPVSHSYHILSGMERKRRRLLGRSQLLDDVFQLHVAICPLYSDRHGPRYIKKRVLQKQWLV